MKRIAVILCLILVACAPQHGNSVKVIGDSITDQLSPVLRTKLAGYNVGINAVPGKRTDEMQGAADEFSAQKPDHVVINLGTNDIAQRYSLGDIEAQYLTMLGKFSDVKCVHVVTVTETTFDERSNSDAAAFNGWLKSQPNVRVVEWAEWIKTHENMTVDFIHPSPGGQDALGNLIHDSITACSQ